LGSSPQLTSFHSKLVTCSRYGVILALPEFFGTLYCLFETCRICTSEIFIYFFQGFLFLSLNWLTQMVLMKGHCYI